MNYERKGGNKQIDMKNRNRNKRQEKTMTEE